MTREDIKSYIKSKPWNRLLSDYDLNNKVEEYAEFYNYTQEQVKNIAYEPVLPTGDCRRCQLNKQK